MSDVPPPLEPPSKTPDDLVERLLQMLEANPDQGLKYAPRLDDGSCRRKSARVAALLNSHEISFDLDTLNEGPSDGAICVSYEMFMRLREMYHKLAMREAQLGRHRRAAYIFAFLLNDYGAAARVLEQGLHFREAAALYQQVGQMEAAGLCLEKGGLWSEALAVWQTMHDYVRVAAIHERLGQLLEAAQAYRKAVDQRSRSG